MKLNLELEKSKIATLKKMIQQLKKSCPNQNIFISFDDNGIQFITEYNMHNRQHIDSFYNLGIQYFSNEITLESKKQQNQIVLRIKDFAQFATNFNQVQDNCSSVNLILSKEGDQRYIKIKSNENNALQTISKSEIMLFFQELEFPRIDVKLFYFSIQTKDICKILDIAAKKEQNMFLQISASKNQDQSCTFAIMINDPEIKIVYSRINIQDWNTDFLEENGSYKKDFIIPYQYCRQLSQICSIDEHVQLSILASDETLCCEFWETDSNEVIIAVKSYVIPNPDDMDDYHEKIEEEEECQEVKEEDTQQQQQELQKKNAVDQLLDDDENDSYQLD